MRKLKSITLALLTVAMFSLVLPLAAAAGSYKWSFSADTGVLTISGTGAMKDFALFSAPWEKHRSNILSIKIESGITAIGSYAFAS